MTLTSSGFSIHWTVTATVGTAAATVAFLSFISTRRNNFDQRLADSYAKVLEFYQDNPDFADAGETRRYASFGGPKLLKYEVLAKHCWAHAEEIVQARVLVVFYRRRFRRQYCNVLEEYHRLHRWWLADNESYILKPSTYTFLRRCRWRDYLPPRKADRLRWENAADGYESDVLNPLVGDPGISGCNSYLDEFIASQSDRGAKVIADVGCGPGDLVLKLAGAGFGSVFALDISEPMLARLEKRLTDATRPLVVLRRADMLNLDEYQGRFDIVFSTNSVLPREPSDTRRILREIRATLKPNGIFVAILPAFDTVEELKKFERHLFVKRRCIKRHRRDRSPTPADRVLGRVDCWRAFNHEQRMSGPIGNTIGKWRVSRYLWRKAFVRVVAPEQFADNAADVQRFILGKRIKREFKRAGLRVVGEPRQSYYTWKEALRGGYGHFAREDDEKTWQVYKDANRIFDWYVEAVKVRPDSDRPSQSVAPTSP